MFFKDQIKIICTESKIYNKIKYSFYFESYPFCNSPVEMYSIIFNKTLYAYKYEIKLWDPMSPPPPF